MNAMIAIITNNAATIQMEDVTHHHDHEITPVSFRTRKTMNRTTGRLAP